MSIVKDAWDALRAVIGMTNDIQRMSMEIRELRKENQEIRDRLMRVETIIDEARTARESRAGAVKRLEKKGD